MESRKATAKGGLVQHLLPATIPKRDAVINVNVKISRNPDGGIPQLVFIFFNYSDLPGSQKILSLYSKHQYHFQL